MDRTEAVTRIQQGLGFRKDLEDVCIAALQEAQREFETGMTLPWFLVEEDQTLPVTFNSQAVPFPPDFLRLVEYEGPYITLPTSGLLYLQVRPYDEAKRFYSSRDAGPPVALAVRAKEFAVWPVPDTGYSVTYSYYKKGELLSSNIENAWLANVPDLLIARAGMIVAGDTEHSASYAKFEAKYNLWRPKYFAEIAAREDQNTARQMGVNN